MWCSICNKRIVDCTCPDIEERLISLGKSEVASITVQQNLEARRLKRGDLKPLGEKDYHG